MEKKLCNICGDKKPLKEFSTRIRNGKIKTQSRCKKCQNKYNRQHYLDNKDKYIKKAKSF
ncbi:unnamed protein product, partial [marine sediment metagenome]